MKTLLTLVSFAIVGASTGAGCAVALGGVKITSRVKMPAAKTADYQKPYQAPVGTRYWAWGE